MAAKTRIAEQNILVTVYGSRLRVHGSGVLVKYK
jgi:hypothetical protein